MTSDDLLGVEPTCGHVHPSECCYERERLTAALRASEAERDIDQIVNSEGWAMQVNAAEQRIETLEGALRLSGTSIEYAADMLNAFEREHYDGEPYEEPGSLTSLVVGWSEEALAALDQGDER